MTAGNAAYSFDADGYLTQRVVDGTDTTAYDYSSTGELKSVTLPDGTLIEYVHDPGGQRIAKKVNGVVTERYLWGSQTNLLAVFDAAGRAVRHSHHWASRRRFPRFREWSRLSRPYE